MPRINAHIRLFLLLSFFAFSVILSSCVTPDGVQPTRIAPDPSLLRVGVSTNTPPLIYKKNGEITGLEADFARKLGSFTGRQVKFIEVKREKQIDALKNNEIDIIMSGMSITATNKYHIAFSEPYLRSGQILLVRLQQKALFSTGIYNLTNSNSIIGTVKDSTGDLFISQFINGAKIKRFTKSEDAVTALINKQIDAFIYDAPMVCHYAAVNENQKLVPILTLATEEFNAWGIRKEDSELLTQANQLIQELASNQQLQGILRTWIPYM